MTWKPISEAPYLGEPFLAAVAVHSAQTKAFMHYDYAVLYMDEGRLHFYDDQSDTGWGVDDYTICLPFSLPDLALSTCSHCGAKVEAGTGASIIRHAANCPTKQSALTAHE